FMMLQDSLDEWYQQKESNISMSFKERVLLEYLWYHVSLCYAENAAENQNVSDELWFGILDIIQQLVWKTFSTTTQAICYYIAEDLTCPIVCETGSDFYQLNCKHIISLKALLSLNNLECPYCRAEIKKDKVYYMPQQTIYNNVQHYITDIEGQSTYDANAES